MSVQLTPNSNVQSAVIAQKIQENSAATTNVDTKSKHNSEISLAVSDHSAALDSRDILVIPVEVEAASADNSVSALKTRNLANVDATKIAEMSKYVSEHFKTVSNNLRKAQKFLDDLNAKNLFGQSFTDINKFIKESNDVIDRMNEFQVQIAKGDLFGALETYDRIKVEIQEAEEAFEPVKKIFNDALKGVVSCCAALFSSKNK